MDYCYSAPPSSSFETADDNSFDFQSLDLNKYLQQTPASCDLLGTLDGYQHGVFEEIDQPSFRTQQTQKIIDFIDAFKEETNPDVHLPVFTENTEQTVPAPTEAAPPEPVYHNFLVESNNQHILLVGANYNARVTNKIFVSDEPRQERSFYDLTDDYDKQRKRKQQAMTEARRRKLDQLFLEAIFTLIPLPANANLRGLGACDSTEIPIFGSKKHLYLLLFNYIIRVQEVLQHTHPELCHDPKVATLHTALTMNSYIKNKNRLAPDALKLKPNLKDIPQNIKDAIESSYGTTQKIMEESYTLSKIKKERTMELYNENCNKKSINKSTATQQRDPYMATKMNKTALYMARNIRTSWTDNYIANPLWVKQETTQPETTQPETACASNKQTALPISTDTTHDDQIKHPTDTSIMNNFNSIKEKEEKKAYREELVIDETYPLALPQKCNQSNNSIAYFFKPKTNNKEKETNETVAQKKNKKNETDEKEKTDKTIKKQKTSHIEPVVELKKIKQEPGIFPGLYIRGL